MQKTKSIALVLGVLAISLSLGYLVLAWTEPSQLPPEGNVPAPINVGSTGQTKTGTLRVGGLTSDSWTYLATQSGNVGIGTASPGYKLDITGDVRWTGTLQGGSVPWARLTGFPSACSAGQYVSAIGSSLTCSTLAGGGGTVTQLNQGTGIILSPNPITTTGSISADTNYLQRRVSGICAAGSSIRVIASDGTVTCETDDVGAGIGGSGTTNYVAKFTAATTIGNSQIFDNGTNVAIGTVTPTWDRKLEVVGGTYGRHTASFIGPNGYGIALGWLADFPTIGSIQAFRKDYSSFANLEINPFGGNVGVGTPTPQRKFEVMGGGPGNLTAAFIGPAAYGSYGVALGIDTNNPYTPTIQGYQVGVGFKNLLINPSGGNIGIGTFTPAYRLDVRGGTVAGAGAYVNTASHSSLKQDFQDVSVLEKISQLRINSWQYKLEFANGDFSTHLYPTADEFYKAFGLGGSELTISPEDIAGVALKGVQEQQVQINLLKKQIEELRNEIEILKGK